MSGTLPPELSYFKDLLREINLAGGSISGSIPDFTDLEKLEILAVNDNCLTGRIPKGFQTFQISIFLTLMVMLDLLVCLMNFAMGRPTSTRTK